MPRTLDREIRAKVERMQAANMDVGLDGAYGRFRVTNRADSVFISPRMPNPHIMEWLNAYQEGWNAAFRELRRRRNARENDREGGDR